MRSHMVAPLFGLLILLFIQLRVICSCRSEYTNGNYRRQGCGLTEVPTNIPSGAKKVYLTNNQISNISAAPFTHLTGCTEVWLKYNTLTLIDAADFVGLESLKTLVLEYNSIADIKPYAFVHLEQCTHIWMKGNRLTQIKADMFNGLRFLEKIVVANNNITDIAAGAFSDLSRCKKLYLRYNELTYIKKEMLEGLESLKYLSLAYNKISNIAGSVFDHIPHCTELFLHGNELAHIRADTFEKLPRLLKLSLSKNRIFDIESGTFTKQTNLNILYLHTNRLTTLRRNIFSSQHQTNLTLLLSYNPLQCDSKICWIKQAERDGWITLNYTRDDDFWSEPDCANYPDQDWDNITLSCPPEETSVENDTKTENKVPDTNSTDPNENIEIPTTNGDKNDINKGNSDDSINENNENDIFYIVGGVAGALLLFCITIFLFLRLRRGRKSEERNEETRVEMNVLRRQALPDPPTNQQHPSSSQSNALLLSGDVTTTHIHFPRHYVAPLPGRDSDGYEVPVRDSDCYEVPIRDSDGYEVPIRDSDGYEVPIRDSDGYEDVIRDSDGYEDAFHNAHFANQDPLYSEIQDGEDN